VNPGSKSAAAIAIAVFAAVFGSLWWETRVDSQPAAAQQAAPAAKVAVRAQQREPSAALQAFLGFAAGDAPPELPLDHRYSADGLRKLAAAFAAEGANALGRDRASRLRAAADELEADPLSSRHADVARAAFVQAAEWITDLRAGADAAALMASAQGVAAERPLRSQGASVDAFFDAAAATLAPG
jgi:hypothetical protein